MPEATQARPDVDGGPNADAWEFLIENKTVNDLRTTYGDFSNVDHATDLITPTETGSVKGTKAAFGSNDMDFKYSTSDSRG